MAGPRDPRVLPGEPKISCDACLKEVPRSEAKSHEGEEYVIWFCGLECYEQWKKAEDSSKERKPS